MKKILLFVFASIISLLSYAQPYFHPTAGISSEYVGSCVENLPSGQSDYWDNGGPSGDYSLDINNVYRVFCPSEAGNCVRVTFGSFNTEFNYDYLTIGNGPTQNSTLFTTAPANASGQLTGNLNAAVPFSYTSTDASGCLTFRFNSDLTVTSPGWSAILEYVPCAGGPSGTDNNDCVNATSICSTNPVSSLSTGPGLVSEYCNGVTCPAGGENFSSWYQFVPQTSGSLNIILTPDNPADDFDFYIFQASDCGSLGAPIRCSDAGVTGSTGAVSTSSGTSEDVNGDGFVSALNVTAGQRYFLVVDKWSPAGTDGFTINFTGSANLDCVILGLDLLSFEADYQPEYNTVDLTWLTNNENNISHYEVERSTNGSDYEVISRVNAVGNTDYKTQYITVDKNPHPGVNYYRLNMHDFDGKSKYSEIKTVNILADEYDVLSVFPNPTTGSTEVIFNSYSKEDAQLILTSGAGEVLMKKSMAVTKGGNHIDLDLHEYQSGIYFITIKTKYKIHRTKIVKK